MTRDRAALPPVPTSRSREEGQVLVIVGLAMVAFMAFVGLVTDSGWSLYQHRVAQNAADAATLAAIRTIATTPPASCNTTTLQTSIDSVVATFVQENAGNDASATWSYIDNNGTAVAMSSGCTGATGVRVSVTAPYSTFLLSIIGISSGNASGNAAARVQNVTSITTDAPFVMCGDTAALVADSATVTATDILSSASPFQLNPAYLDRWFILHDPQISQSPPSGMGSGSCADDQSSFKGRTDPDTFPNPLTLPDMVDWDTGTQAGPARARVCAACGLPSGCNPDGCQLVLPIAVDDTPSSPCGGTDTGGQTCVIGFATFEINEGPPPAPYDYSSCGSSNCHSGKLLGATPYKGSGTSSDTWGPGSPGAVALRLVE